MRDSIAPKAVLVGTNVTAKGASAYTFNVVYTDSRGIKKRTIDAKDVLVTGPNGFRQQVAVEAVKFNRKGTRAVVTYRIVPPGGSWDFADNGAYSVLIQRKQVSDKSGNFVKAGKAGTFKVNIAQDPSGGGTDHGGTPPPPPPGDTVAPTASLTPPQVTANSGEVLFNITYADNVSIDISTLDSQDVVVTGPGGFTQIATLVSVDTNSNGTPRTATYRINAPGGSWGAADNGTYTVSVRANQVKDINGNFAAAGSAGTFQVSLAGPDDTFNGSAGDNALDGGEGSDTVNYSSLSKGVVVNLETGRALKPLYGGIKTPKILPLGDSITYGEHRDPDSPGAYRVKLYENYVADSFGIDFVGSRSNGPSTNFDRNNEGRPGFTIDEIKGVVDDSGYFDNYDPDVVLLMIGTNDTADSRFVSVAEMRKDIVNLVNEIASKAPDALVVLSSIIPTRSSSRNGRNQNYNDQLPGVASELSAQGKKVTFVNVGDSLSDSDLIGDGIHPTEAGYAKLGDAWYKELVDRDTLNSIENVIGTSSADTLIGNSGVNVIEGLGGADTLTGSGGSDSFVYRSASHGNDTITDFSSSDFIQISASGFGGALVAGTSLSNGSASATGVFVAGTTPVGSSANFLYNSGVLRFDPDGTGGAGAQIIATLSGSPTLNASRFNIVA